MCKSNLDPQIEARLESTIEAHGKEWENELKKEGALRKKLRIPNHVPRYENKTLTFDQCCLEACEGETTDGWIALRSLVLSARVASTEVESYRDDLALILRLLRAPVHKGEAAKRGYSVHEINEHLSEDDLQALVYEIWKQNPGAVKEVPCKTVWNDEPTPPAETKNTIQVFLFDDVQEYDNLGIVRSDDEGWRLGLVNPKAYFKLAGWREKKRG